MAAKFIVIEGPDGAGTTHHSQLLVERMQKEGLPVLWTAEPTEGPIGKQIRNILHSDKPLSPDAIQLLFCADRAEHVASVIKAALEQGTYVVCDRYELSTIVYGAAQGLDREWLRSINAVFPSPDITVLALPPFEVCKERIMRREERDQFENEPFQRKVYDHYQNEKTREMIVLDTSGDLKATADELWNQINGKLS